MSPLRRLIWSALVVTALGLLAEGMARLMDPQLPGWRSADNPAVVMIGHPSRLWGLGPGTRDNAGTTASIHAAGLRGQIPSLPRPEGRQRILVLGDSSFFGFGVADDNTLDVAMIQKLAAHGLDVDGINGGIPGYSTEQIRILLTEVGWSLEPTLLILGALWSDTNFESYRDRDLLRSSRFSDHPLARSAVMRLLATGLTRWTQPKAGQIVTWPRNQPRPEAQHRRVPLSDYAENLMSIALDAAKRGVGVVFVSPTASVELEAASDAPYQWDAYRSTQAAVATHLGVPWIDTRIAFRAASASPGSPPLFLDDLHPTPVGVDHMAQAIVDSLKQADWPNKALLAQAQADPPAVIHDPHDGQSLPENERVQSPLNNLFSPEGSSSVSGAQP